MVELQSRVPNDEVFGMQRLGVQPRGGKEEERERGRMGRTEASTVYSPTQEENSVTSTAFLKISYRIYSLALLVALFH